MWLYDAVPNLDERCHGTYLAMHRTVACERVIPRDLDLRRLRHWVKTAMIGSGAQANERI
jgi:hypothetical protein